MGPLAERMHQHEASKRLRGYYPPRTSCDSLDFSILVMLLCDFVRGLLAVYYPFSVCLLIYILEFDAAYAFFNLLNLSHILTIFVI